MYLFVDKKKALVFFSQRRELLTISSSPSSKHGRELTIKKKGWNSSKLQALTREVWSSPRPHGLQEEIRSSLPHLLKQKESSFQVTLGKRREFLSSRELPYLLVSRLFLKKMEATLLLARVKGDRAPPASKKKSPLPHLRQEETSSFLQSDGTEESFISTKQAGPSNLTRKKRAPPTPQSAKNFLPHSLGKGKNRAPDCLLFLFRRWKRAYAPEESMEFPRPAKIKVWSSPSPAVKKVKMNTLLHAPIPAAWRDFQLSSIADSAWLIPSSFPATMLWKTFNRKESHPPGF